MSPRPRRRSARLASSAVKPMATQELSSLAERDETPPREDSESLDALRSPTRPDPQTPMSSAIKPPHDEMHPSKVRPTTGEPSSALRLGFSDIPSSREGPQPAALASTPSKIGGVASSPFTFRFAREAADKALSSDSQRMMEQIRGQAAKIKAELIAQKDDQGASPKTSGRVIAKLKGKSGRFSAVHSAEFSKMDSIEGHASASRAQNGRFTPAKSSLKRSPSKANLDATPLSHGSVIRATPVNVILAETPDKRSTLHLKRTSSVANLDCHQTHDGSKEPVSTTSPEKFLSLAQRPNFKRPKQRYEDNSSSTRPVWREAGSLPRPVTRGDNTASLSTSQSGLARLMSPTKSSMAHAAGLQDSTRSTAISSPKPSQPGIPKSGLAAGFDSLSKTVESERRIISPSGFQKVKSILRGQKVDKDGAINAIPQPAPQVSQTLAPRRTNNALPPLPQTTPRRKFAKRVDFTPETANAAMAQDSPSPQKPHRPPLQAVESYHFVGLEEVLAKSNPSSNGLYPDLSPLKRLVEPRSGGGNASSPSMGGTFTFRSDHTIKFGTAATRDFGASPGQSSIRQVRGSMMPATEMPGSFPPPPSPSCHPNKENAASSPARLLRGTAHGMPNKKRHRASSDEEDAENEAAERALKKRKNEHVPEGQALLAPRLMGKTPVSGVKKSGVGRTPSKTPSRLPGRIPGSVSPSKKGSVLSVSHLSMLARPKNRG